MAGECRRPAAGVPVFTGGERRAHGEGQKGKRAPGMVPFPPLDSPKPSFEPLSEAFAAKRGKRGLGSVRRAGFWKPHFPEFTLRYPPRITVRGQTVQGGGVPLRKVPLQSSAVSWSTRRPCGLLAFRRATEGSRVLRRVWGSQEGAREPFGALAPFCPSPWARRTPPVNTGTPAAGRRPPSTLTLSVNPPPAASRRNGGTAYPLLRVKIEGPCFTLDPPPPPCYNK